MSHRILNGRMKTAWLWRISLLCLCAFSPFNLNAQVTQKTLDAARNEGRVVFYTVLSLPESQALVQGFQKKYSFLKVDLFRLGAEKMRTKILTEASAGRHLFDVTSMDIVETGVLQRQKILGTYQASAREAIPAGLKDKEGYWTAIYVRPFVLAYNTQLVSEKDVPKDWWELLDGRWRGKIGMDEEETEWYASLVHYWGKDKARKFMRGLAAQNPVRHRGHTLIANLTVAGEFPLSIAYASRIEEVKAAGAPIDWVDRTDPIVASPSVISLSGKAPHPNAGRVLVEYVLSHEGQMLLQKRFRVTVRSDLPPLSQKLELKRLRVFFVDPKIADHYAEFQREYHEIFGS